MNIYSLSCCHRAQAGKFCAVEVPTVPVIGVLIVENFDISTVGSYVYT